MWLVLAACGYETFSWGGALKRLFCYDILVGQNRGFVPAFNAYLRGASRRNLYYTLGILIAMFSLCGTLFNANVYHHVFWYAVLYLVGAAIRMYPFKWMECNKICVLLLAASVVVAWCSVVGLNFLAYRQGRPTWYPHTFVADSHKLLAFTCALFAFLVFRNWKLPQSKFINAVASTVFGVLLIHDASDGMRKWLWQNFVNVSGAFSFSFWALVGYSVMVVVGVFAVCSAFDYLRIRFVERPLFKLWTK